MIETIVREHLNKSLTVPAYMEVPKGNALPEKYVLIEKLGSGKSNHIFAATIALQSYAGSLYAAATLNEEVKEAMDKIIALNEVCSANLNSDYNFTDTARKQYRYQAVYDLVHY